MKPIKLRALFMFLAPLAAAYPTQAAEDYFHVLIVRYPHGLVKTFLGGPYSPLARCEKLAQTVWDNVVTTCGNCRNEQQGCLSGSKVPAYYMDTFRNQPIPIPYVSAVPKGRILFSGVTKDVALAECRHTASQFRTGGFQSAQCISQ